MHAVMSLAFSVPLLLVCLLNVTDGAGSTLRPNDRRARRAAGNERSAQRQTQYLSSSSNVEIGPHNIPPSYRTSAKHCYQCSYSLPRTSQKDSSSKVKLAPASAAAAAGVGDHVAGGWDKCLGPFDEQQATEYGVDVWQCYSNCYVRRDPNGDIFRGCYNGEYGVDPSLDGCRQQAGAIYCFCDGDRCNGGSAPVARR